MLLACCQYAARVVAIATQPVAFQNFFAFLFL
jgi:hypothetical protein